MSLYNMLNGVNQLAAGLLTLVLKKEPSDFDRLRDIYLHRKGDDMVIVVLTRTGGGNREYHEENWEAIRAMPGYICDYDDDFDSTYAYTEFELPEDNEIRQHIKEVLADHPDAEDVIFPPGIQEKTMRAINALKGGTS